MTNDPQRYYCFTINNPTDVDRKQLDSLCPDTVYLCYGNETGSQTLTPHLQGYAELTKPQRFSWIKKRLPRAYLAPRRGSRTQARDYCFKECTNPFEYGTFKPDKQGARNELLACKNAIDEGYSMAYLWEEHFTTMVRCSRAMHQYALIAAKRFNWGPIECLWIYGPSGSGKSRYAWDTWPDAFNKENNKWWDGYTSEETVIWDDFSMPREISYQELLRWTDRYKKTGETKGGTIPLTYKRIVFTCCDAPRFDEQFTRRFNDGVNITPVTSLQITD